MNSVYNIYIYIYIYIICIYAVLQVIHKCIIYMYNTYVSIQVNCTTDVTIVYYILWHLHTYTHTHKHIYTQNI